jgi:uncharacterized protein (DUF2236 family)
MATKASARLETDLGLFGPGSMAWMVHREPAMLVGGLRALMYQALHPLAIAAVRDFSTYTQDVWGRYQRTSNYVTTTIFGTTRQAAALGARVQAIHRPIHGVDTITGLPYAASDPTLLLWIHATLVDSFIVAYRRFVRPLMQTEADQYVAELVRQAELVGLRANEVPKTEMCNLDFIDSCRPILQATAPAMVALHTVLRPPLPTWSHPFWWLVGQAAMSIMPDHAMKLYGRHHHQAVESLVRPLVSAGSEWARDRLRPPPVLAEARRKARAVGYRL